ncbi:hypothetical protein OGAPHI_000935 [Ogataea philodendri]|uniref:Zn(2)-C6 fungal-type domain-containing protein n=1 Tax=Ogataea philodendri TaxID=1378263 RepID=A0A9P8PF58_9ASCO|nr:uncharacterized protein OGAPHI_000935 [Ogataea philodendri]KAH3670420.1 hypothetical protein OGAPHI_000935 [Ogataea philodendri]
MRKAEGMRQKSRGGCITCKKSKIKCDEAKPKCSVCTNRGIECGGYIKIFKFKEVKSTVGKRGKKINLAEREDVLAPQLEDGTLTQQFNKAAQSITGRTYKQLALEQHLAKRGKNPMLATELDGLLRRFRVDSFEKLAMNSERYFQVRDFMFSSTYSPFDQTQFVLNTFDTATGNVLCVYESQGLNPWKTQFLPLIKEYPILVDLIGMIVCRHLCAKHPELNATGFDYKVRACLQLSQGIKDKKLSNDICLASCFLLSLDELWDAKPHLDLSHLSVLSYFVNRRLSSPNQDPRFNFIISAWQYMRVISRATFLNPNLAFNTSDPNMLLCDGLEMDHILGMCQELFGLLDKVMDLLYQVKDLPESVYPGTVVKQAEALQQRLINWTPPPADLSSWSDKEIHDQMQAAEAHRHSSLLLLQKVFPQIKPHMRPTKLASIIKSHISSIKITSGSVVPIMVFPLFISSCEAFAFEDRAWYKMMWRAVFEATCSSNFLPVMDVVEEVWRRKDELLIHYKSQNLLLEFDDHLIGGFKSYANWHQIIQDWKIDLFVG